jgi:hypothetical protein
MPYSILKVSKTVDGEVEVVGEFPNGDEAHTFAQDAQANDNTNEYEYLIEFQGSAGAGKRRRK